MRSEDDLCIFQFEFCSENGLNVKSIFDQMKIDYSADHGHTNKASLGIILSNMEKYDQAEEYLRRSFDKTVESSHPDACSVGHNLQYIRSFLH